MDPLSTWIICSLFQVLIFCFSLSSAPFSGSIFRMLLKSFFLLPIAGALFDDMFWSNTLQLTVQSRFVFISSSPLYSLNRYFLRVIAPDIPLQNTVYNVLTGYSLKLRTIGEASGVFLHNEGMPLKKLFEWSTELDKKHLHKDIKKEDHSPSVPA